MRRDYNLNLKDTLKAGFLGTALFGLVACAGPQKMTGHYQEGTVTNPVAVETVENYNPKGIQQAFPGKNIEYDAPLDEKVANMTSKELVNEYQNVRKIAPNIGTSKDRRIGQDGYDGTRTVDYRDFSTEQGLRAIIDDASQAPTDYTSISRITAPKGEIIGGGLNFSKDNNSNMHYIIEQIGNWNNQTYKITGEYSQPESQIPQSSVTYIINDKKGFVTDLAKIGIATGIGALVSGPIALTFGAAELYGVGVDSVKRHNNSTLDSRLQGYLTSQISIDQIKEDQKQDFSNFLRSKFTMTKLDNNRIMVNHPNGWAETSLNYDVNMADVKPTDNGFVATISFKDPFVDKYDLIKFLGKAAIIGYGVNHELNRVDKSYDTPNNLTGNDGDVTPGLDNVLTGDDGIVTPGFN